MEKGCARAQVQMHSTHDLWKALSKQPPTHIPNLNAIGQVVSEIQKRGLGASLHVRTYVQRYPIRDYCISYN